MARTPTPSSQSALAPFASFAPFHSGRPALSNPSSHYCRPTFSSQSAPCTTRLSSSYRTNTISYMTNPNSPSVKFSVWDVLLCDRKFKGGRFDGHSNPHVLGKSWYFANQSSVAKVVCCVDCLPPCPTLHPIPIIIALIISSDVSLILSATPWN